MQSRRLRFVGLLLALACTAFMSGCVLGRRDIALDIPSGAAAQATRGQIRIAEVADARHFQNDPRSPSTPSIDGDVTKVTPAELQMFIGRQRNGFGGAKGDIVLSSDTTVPDRVRKLLASGFVRRGFTPTDDVESPTAVDVKVNEFWAWFSPGAFSVSFEARIETLLNITADGLTKSLTVKGYGANRGQVASDANWQLAYARAFEDYLKNLDAALGSAGL